MTSTRGETTLLAGSGLGAAVDWRAALAAALDSALPALAGAEPDALILFVSGAYGEHFAALLAEARARTHARQVIGCSASAVIGQGREVEDEPALTALLLRLPADSAIDVRRVPADQAARSIEPGWLGHAPNGLIVLADPFSTDVDALIHQLDVTYPGVPVMGGLATSAPGWRHTFLFHGAEVLEDGALVVGLSGKLTVKAVVSQGCEPIGQAWTVTDSANHIVKTIGGRPAYEVLMETVRGLDPARRVRVNGNLLVGLAMDEYRDEFRRGDFLIRNLMGVDPQSGALALAAHVAIGQTLQFQIRDARAADEELRHMLGAAMPADRAAAALLFACNGRGVGLFGAPDHDAGVVRDVLGPVPVAGLFCNGEIGPVGPRTFLHGFTASLALIGATE